MSASGVRHRRRRRGLFPFPHTRFLPLSLPVSGLCPPPGTPFFAPGFDLRGFSGRGSRGGDREKSALRTLTLGRPKLASTTGYKVPMRRFRGVCAHFGQTPHLYKSLTTTSRLLIRSNLRGGETTGNKLLANTTHGGTLPAQHTTGLFRRRSVEFADYPSREAVQGLAR